jgi:hypothetical protein
VVLLRGTDRRRDHRAGVGQSWLSHDVMQKTVERTAMTEKIWNPNFWQTTKTNRRG